MQTPRPCLVLRKPQDIGLSVLSLPHFTHPTFFTALAGYQHSPIPDRVVAKRCTLPTGGLKHEASSIFFCVAISGCSLPTINCQIGGAVHYPTALEEGGEVRERKEFEITGGPKTTPQSLPISTPCVRFPDPAIFCEQPQPGTCGELSARSNPGSPVASLRALHALYLS